MRFVVVGGGVAGVCCAEELCRLRPDDDVALVSASRVLKGVSVVARLSRNLEELALVERRLDELPYPNLRLVQDVAAGVDTEAKELLLGSGQRLPYDKLCICAGARPKQLPPHVFRAAAAHGPAQGTGQEQAEQAEVQQRVLTIRDTDSVARLAACLRAARRVAVVGNGGIALELISGLKGADVTWILKHAQIGDAYFDYDAAQFLLEEMQAQRCASVAPQQQAQQPNGTEQQPAQQPQQQPQQPVQQQQLPVQQQAPAAGVLGHAVGPRWVQQLPPAGPAGGSGSTKLGTVELEYGCEVASIQLAPASNGGSSASAQQAAASGGSGGGGSGEGGPSGRPLRITLSNGRQIEADLVLLAIGVRPALEWVPPSVQRAPDGGLRLNRHMQSSDPAIYAAGDSASCLWAAEESRHWFQMRLWSQARAMGVYAAHCMAGVQDQTGADMAFELFTHVTHFLGKKVVLLGLYNGQRLEGEPARDCVSYSRVDEGPEGRSFVRVLLLRGRLQGAVLIGDTDLDETLENLILDQLDVSEFGPHLLDPEVELDHVFD